MRFIHTADWHLGRLMHGVHLTEDQAHVLDQFVHLVKEAKAELVIVAGDVFDRAVPPTEAVSLLDDVLSRLVLDIGVPVIIIAGNHDSAPRLQFGSKLLAEERLYVFGALSADVPTVQLEDQWGPVQCAAIPYSEPSTLRERFSEESISNHQEAFQFLLGNLQTNVQEGRRTVLVAHAFVGDGLPSESERPLSVGGFDRVDASLFRGANYAALGHLHRPQSAGYDHVSYSGSLLKYSFSESDHVKGVNVVEMNQEGVCNIEKVSLTPRRDVRRIEGLLKDLLEGPRSGENRDDYISAVVTDTEPILDVMGKLREVYPNVLHVERPFFDAYRSSQGDRADHRKLNDVDLFKAFFLEVTGQELKQEHIEAYQSVIEDLRKSQSEETAL
ncbi:MAG: exonuclease SbcCD subunit D [Desulfomonilaceae bacterium]